MNDQPELPDAWFGDGRHFAVTTCTGPDKTWWELDELGLAVEEDGRLPVEHSHVAVEQDDDSRRVIVYFEAPDHRIPFEVLEGFVRYARERIDVMNEFFDSEQAAKEQQG